MKPVSVRFKCFGPYMTEQRIDFEQLQKNGLFLISGETGSGKTTILDAMCYALYGRSSGGLRGDLSVMRCKLAGKEDETLAEFIFDSNGKRYKFIRSLKYGRKNLNDTHNCLVWEGEEYVPIFENPKATYVNQKAQELLGLTYDQFRQVVILPQGQFEKLLVSDSSAKEKILVSLFHADRWQKIAEEVYRRVAERDTALKLEKASMDAKLREYGCTAIAQLEEKTAAGAEAVARLTGEAAAAEAAVRQCREASDRAILENRAFAELAKHQARLTSLQEQTEFFAAEEVLLGSAEKAEAIRPCFAAFREAQSGQLRAEGILAMAQRAAEAAGKELALAQSRWQEHDASRETYEAGKQQLILLENARNLYSSLEEKKWAAKQAKTALAQAMQEKERAEREYLRRDEAWQQAVLEQNKAIGDYQAAQNSYLRGIGSTLAEKLTPGEPCPVCGSREHPAPAQKTQDHITEVELEAKNEAVDRAGKQVTATLRQRMEGEKQKKQAETAYGEEVGREAAARADYEHALEGRISGIETEQQLNHCMEEWNRRLEAYARAEASLQQRLQEVREKDTAARGKLDAAREELTAAQLRLASQRTQWLETLEASGLKTEENFRRADLAPEEKQRRTMALANFRAERIQTQNRVREEQEALSGKTAPDMEGIQTALQQAEAEYKAVSAQLLLTGKEWKTMEADARSLQKRQDSYTLARIQTDGDMDYANRLRGRSGVSLQRYVLGVMLTSVASEANRLLEKVYGGRYRLYRTDEISGSGHKGGLELEVYDSQTNARRSVTTLSGGEKFLVALSLAIGLSTVVQAQGGGIRLEAMFIDEGFGSLDKEAVNDALEVLQGIQRSAGVVGIISHVEVLAEVIPTRLEITKGRQGSTCHVRG